MIEAGDERRMGSSALNLTIDTGNVAVAGLSFTYPGAAAPSLTDIDLKIEAGERIAIVGRVASGKSTLGRLLCGLYAPEAGNIRSEEHTSELQSLMRISYAVFCLKKKNKKYTYLNRQTTK